VKLLIATRCDSNIEEMSSVTMPTLKAYAYKCGADLCCLDSPPPVWTNERPPRAHYRIMDLYKLYDDYDRILSLDCDLLVSPACPDIFKEVPEDTIGSIFEDVGSRASHRRDVIHKVQRRYTDVGWKQGYINSGVFLTSKCHRDIFTPIDGTYWMDFGYDDIHFGYQIHSKGFTVHELDFKWNHMTMFSEEWNGCADRFDSYIIHYAGAGLFNSGHRNRVAQIISDAKHLERLHE